MALRDYGLEGWRNTGYTGVWVGGDASRGHTSAAEPGDGPQPPGAPGPRKIASIGVHARDWVTWHGFALNVTTDLSYFDLMIPCGIDQVRMTSVATERPDLSVDVAQVGRRVSRAFAEVFAHQTERH